MGTNGDRFKDRTIRQAMDDFLASLNALHTQHAYATPLKHYAVFMATQGVHVDRDPVTALTVDHAIDFIALAAPRAFSRSRPAGQGHAAALPDRRVPPVPLAAQAGRDAGSGGHCPAGRELSRRAQHPGRGASQGPQAGSGAGHHSGRALDPLCARGQGRRSRPRAVPPARHCHRRDVTFHGLPRGRAGGHAPGRPGLADPQRAGQGQGQQVPQGLLGRDGVARAQGLSPGARGWRRRARAGPAARVLRARQPLGEHARRR